MPDANELLKAMKRAAIDAMESTKPVNICFGEVINTSPLQIDIEQKMVLNKAQLILSRAVTDYTTAIEVQNEGEQRVITMNNALQIGDNVMLIRQLGGQKYFVIDRIGGM